MSKAHPIVAVTGSSGAGTTAVTKAFEHMFARQGVHTAMVQGDSFHRYDRAAMNAAVERAQSEGRTVTHFGPEGNLFEELETLFREYAERGTGQRRFYVHTEEEGRRHNQAPGTFTAWESLPPNTDLLFYEGLHGGLVTDSVNIARYCDLLIGVVPIINLEWIQKIHRDRAVRGYSTEAATRMILSRMHDYVHYITPQFSLTDINFQRVPTIDTSNPFAAPSIPSNEESAVVIHINDPAKISAELRELVDCIDGSFLSRPDTIVVPAVKKIDAIEILITPVILGLLDGRRQAA